MLLEILLVRNVFVSIAHFILLFRDGYIDPQSWVINIVLWGLYFYIYYDKKKSKQAA